MDLDTKENPFDVFSCPAKLTPELENKIKEIALNAYKTLRCRDWSRIDIRMNADNVPNIIEINPLPGIFPDPKGKFMFSKSSTNSSAWIMTEMLK